MMTVQGVAVYPHLNTPDTKFKDEGEYHTKLRITAETADELRQAFRPLQDDEVAKVTKDQKGKKPNVLDLPLTPETDDAGNETGDFLIRVKMKASGTSKKTGKAYTRTVPIFDAKGRPSNAKIGGGSVLNVSFEPRSFVSTDTKSKPPKKEVGVTLYLEAVQIIELREGGNGPSASKFGFKATDGYDATDEAAPAADAEGGDEEGGEAGGYNF